MNALYVLLTILGYSLPVQIVDKGMSSDATDFTGYSTCLCNNYLLLLLTELLTTLVHRHLVA